MSVLRHRSILAASFLVLAIAPARAQSSQPDKHDSITVTTLTFPGAKGVSVDDLRRLLYTRRSTCRLPFLIPVCKVSASQLFTDRRRTTRAILGDDMTKLRVYYWQRGFREAAIDTVLTPQSRGSAVAFRIVEGPPTVISPLTITQRTPVLDAQELADALTIHEGEPFNLVALDSTLARLKAVIWNKGYGDVRIDTIAPRPDTERRVPLRINIDPRWITRVGTVDFEGNHYLADGTLRRGVLLQPGTLYTRDAVLESQKRLFQSPAIARALVVTPPAGDSIKAITVDVTETQRRHVALTAGFNTIDFGQVAAEVRHNALGAGRWLSLHGAIGNLLGDQLSGRAIFQRALPNDVSGDPQGFLRPTYQASLTLTQPWIAGARTSASVSAFAGRRAIPNVVIDEDVGVTVGVVRELSPRTPVGVHYRLESTRVQGSAVYFCAGYGICDAATRDALSRRQRLAPVGASAWVDRADDLENPTRGYTAVIDAEHASSATGSTFAHSRIAADGSMYRAIGTRRIVGGEEVLPKVLAVHARAGYVRAMSDRGPLGISGAGAGILHPRARFYAGGMQSVRGFAENELGPQVLQARRSALLAVGCSDVTIENGQCDPTPVSNEQLFPRPIGGSSVIEASVELRVPLFKMLGGVVFLDGASVGTSGSASLGHAKTAVTPGAGFRYRSPLGVLRLDIGLRPVGAEMLPVVVAVADAQGRDRIVQLAREKRFSPVEPSPGALRSVARRLVVHFAMGQAF